MKRLAEARIASGLCPKCGESKGMDTITCRRHAEIDRMRKHMKMKEVAA
jgi:hypothetical protein